MSAYEEDARERERMLCEAAPRMYELLQKTFDLLDQYIRHESVEMCAFADLQAQIDDLTAEIGV